MKLLFVAQSATLSKQKSFFLLLDLNLLVRVQVRLAAAVLRRIAAAVKCSMGGLLCLPVDWINMKKQDIALKELEDKIKDCSKCANLCSDRQNIVFGDGNADADLLFIGEAPGKNEDIQAKPFVGAAGKLLSELLASIGLGRDQVYIANVLKCRPPNNRDPLPEEINVCKPILFEQIKIIKPKIIATLGAHATKLILNKPVSISKIHGQKIMLRGYVIFPIYHPAAALYARSTLKYLEEDFIELKATLENTKKVAWN